MADENKIRDAADAIKGIVEAVPIYQDAIQPAAKEVGLALQTAAKTIHIALAPISALVWGYDTIREFVTTRVAEKLKGVPLENIRTPEPHVVGPALEALRYTGHQETLRELYANLLATSLDSETCRQAHPAFVDMIKEMSPDEARVMRLFATVQQVPVVQLRAFEKDREDYHIAVRCYSRVGHDSGCDVPELVPSYFDNLRRLGLLELPGDFGMGAPMLAAPNTYEPLEQEAAGSIGELKAALEARGGRLAFDRGLIRLTTLGRQFCQACVIEKGSAAA